MKVLLVAAASSVHTMRWANAFVQRGWIVHLASQHDPLPGFDQAVVLHRLPHVAGAGYVLNRPALKRIIDRVKPDVVNAHYASGYGTLAVHDAHVPMVLNVWGSDVYDFPQKGRVHHWLLERNLRRADAIVSTSEAMARRTNSICPGLGHIHVVPFGVDTALFAPASPRTERSAITVGTVKTLAPTYGIDTLVRAFALLRQRSENGGSMRLRIVGGGPQHAELKRLVRSLELVDVVEMTGPVPHGEVPQELRKLDVYVALSRSESFGVAVIEASACAIPVLVSNVGGLPEVVEDGVTGFIVPPGDVEAAAAKLGELVASKDLRTRMGYAGRDRVMKHYAWESCVDRQLAVFATVINERKGT